MVFNSMEYIAAISAIFLVYWLIPRGFQKVRTVFLLIVSYVFYFNWNPSYTLILLGITVITYFAALQMGKFNSDSKEPKKKSFLISISVLCLLPLIIFKYYNFINENVYVFLRLIGLHFKLPGLNIAVPVGLSFYTLQALGYLLDVYHGKSPAENDFIDYSLFVSFFPQIASGPISKSRDLLPQIKENRKFDYDCAVTGVKWFLLGLFIKTTIADRGGIYVDTFFSNIDKYSGLNCMIASIVYSVQIYTDFYGYSLMAMGSAKLLGFDLVCNFKRPYFSLSITDFWRRWHISLSTWLKDHVYIPLGGSRCSALRNAYNILVTFLVSGIWHGANWTYIVWGVFHGAAQIVEKRFKLDRKNKQGIKRLPYILCTFLLVNFAWIIFRSPDIRTACIIIGKMFSFKNGLNINTEGLAYFIINTIPFALYETMMEFRPSIINRFRNSIVYRWGTLLFLLMMILMTGVLDGSNFIYVSF